MQSKMKQVFGQAILILPGEFCLGILSLDHKRITQVVTN